MIAIDAAVLERHGLDPDDDDRICEPMGREPNLLELIEDASRTCSRPGKQPGDVVILLGDNRGELGGSGYLARLHGTVQGMPPALDLERARALQRLIVQLIQGGTVPSARDCAEGGLAIALAERTMVGNGDRGR